MLRAIVLGTALSLMASAAYANLVAEQTVSKEEIYTQADGTEAVRLVAPEKVVPGSNMVVTLAYKNEGEQPASGINLRMPIPSEMTYIENSAANVGEVMFSVDGGQTFSPRSELMVSDGDAQRPAQADDITAIRWYISDEITAGESGELSFKAKIK